MNFLPQNNNEKVSELLQKKKYLLEKTFIRKQNPIKGP